MSSTAEQFTWPQILGSVTDGADLTVSQARWAMNEIMSDAATSAQIAAFAVGVKMKGAAPSELQGLAEAMLEHATLVDIDGTAVDIVGTGGDRSHTVNISTMTAMVVAAAGVAVVKHGNRAASSKSGGADVLEALGVKIDQSAAQVAASVAQLGIGFCFAAKFHPAFRFVGPTRKEIGIPTVFNVLGPLTNPASPRAGLIGCAFADLAPVLAETFAQRGSSVLVVRGDDGLDEFTTTSTTTVWQVTGGVVTQSVIDPRDLGIGLVELEQLRGGDAEHNATVVHDLFSGKPGPVRDAVLLNAAGAIVAAEQSGPLAGPELTEVLRDALGRAAVAIDSGGAARLLANWAALTNR